MRTTLLALCAWLALACAGKGADPFPRGEELDRLAALPAGEPVLPRGALVLDAWALEEPLPDRVDRSPVPLDLPAERALAERVAGGASVVATQGMRCFARQLARILVSHRAQFVERQLAQFLSARCGVAAAAPAYRWLAGDARPELADAEVVARFREPIAGLVGESLDGRGERIAGTALARDGGRFAFVVAHAEAPLEVVPTDLRLAPDGRFALAGTLREELVDLSAWVGRGALGAARCEAAPGLAPPAFRFECAADPGDGWNWVTVQGRRPDRILSELLLAAVVREPREPAATFRRAYPTAPRELHASDDAEAVFTDHVNRVRASVGAPPLRVSSSQSARAAGLAPHFFRTLRDAAAPDGTPPDRVQDLVVLGMLAGWDVEGLVAGGHFVAPWAPSTRDVSALLSSALQLPSARHSLLDAEARQIALAVVRDDEGGGLGAIVATYSFLEPGSLDAAAGSLLARLAGERAQRGLPAPRELRGLDALAMRAADEVRRGSEPRDALDRLLEGSVQQLRLGVEGFFQEAAELEDFAFPEPLLSEPELGVAVGVSVHRPADQPWGRYVVFFVSARLGGWYR